VITSNLWIFGTTQSTASAKQRRLPELKAQMFRATRKAAGLPAVTDRADLTAHVSESADPVAVSLVRFQQYQKTTAPQSPA